MSKKSLAVVFGGASSEYEVSLSSSSSVISNIPEDLYHVILIGISKDGRWFHYTGPVEHIRDGSWLEKGPVCPAVISPDRSHKGILELDGDGWRLLKVDVVFPVLHGRNGEDGTIQGLLELADIPYVGCGVTASAMCMDKAITHTMLDLAGIPTARWARADVAEMERFDELEQRLSSQLGYPMFIKPANAGSSVGISKARDKASLRAALELAFRHDKKAVAEETITGREVECAVMGNGQPFASILGEIVPCNEFYDYEAKYQNDATELYVPARVSEEESTLVRELAVAAFKVLGCRGMCRIDFFVREDGSVILNEPNTIPGFTNISMYPKLMQASGMTYSQLIDRLVRLALDR
ncbi:MAG: D-alanine--D-alanine ligase [Oscillospiraceae bacterium]|nr:D-alanine--D-alanine ligase [Oscillospiraceae bacterium]